MWGRVRGCQRFVVGCCAATLCQSTGAGVIIAPPVAAPDQTVIATRRLDSVGLAPVRSPWQVTPQALATRIAPSPLSILPGGSKNLPAQTIVAPIDHPASAPFIRGFSLGVERTGIAPVSGSGRPLVGVIPPPELPDSDPFAEDLFAARAQSRSGIVEFFSVPAPSGVLAFTPLALLAARRRRGC